MAEIYATFRDIIDIGLSVIPPNFLYLIIPFAAIIGVINAIRRI